MFSFLECLHFLPHVYIYLENNTKEMTGIQLPSREAKDICKDESPENRYPFMKLVPERYSIIQLGICLFGHKSSDDSTASVRRYKFTLFPPADPKISRDITLNPSAIHFLLENDMDLNFWAKEGMKCYFVGI